MAFPPLGLHEPLETSPEAIAVCQSRLGGEQGVISAAQGTNLLTIELPEGLPTDLAPTPEALTKEMLLEVVLDDLMARRSAKRLRIPYLGTLGLVLTAKQLGLIPEARPVVDRLRQIGLYLADEPAEDLLRRIGG
jgi:hypothetical protein